MIFRVLIAAYRNPSGAILGGGLALRYQETSLRRAARAMFADGNPDRLLHTRPRG